MNPFFLAGCLLVAACARKESGETHSAFDAASGVTVISVDKQTGKRATPMCPAVIDEAFLDGTEPKDFCDLHGGMATTRGCDPVRLQTPCLLERARDAC